MSPHLLKAMETPKKMFVKEEEKIVGVVEKKFILKRFLDDFKCFKPMLFLFFVSWWKINPSLTPQTEKRLLSRKETMPYPLKSKSEAVLRIQISI